MFKEMSQTAINNYFDSAGEKAEIKNRFMPGVYSKYNVKRGLRNGRRYRCTGRPY